MISCVRFAMALIVIAACGATGRAAEAATDSAAVGTNAPLSRLKIGDPAPPLRVARWFKGGPVTGFETGRIYVVEFWATWCGPCRQSMPHLTELARSLEGRAEILGVSIWESEKTDHAKRLDDVGKFVERMGDKMNYRVAADDNNGFMARNWMEAANEGGIPTAFIVDRDGRIAWIGNPWGGFEPALHAVIAGTLDAGAVAAEAATRQKEKDDRARRIAWLASVTELQKAGRTAEAVTALDRVVAEHPELAEKTGTLRFKLLMGHDQPAAYALLRKLLEGDLKNNANVLYGIGRDLTDPPGPKIKDWDLAMTVAQRACELSQFNNHSHLSVLAEACAGKGDYSKAIEIMQRALEQAAGDAGAEGSRKYLERRLQSFKDAQAAAPSTTRR